MRFLASSVVVVQVLLLAAATAVGQVEANPGVSNTMPTPNFGFMLPSRLGTLSYSLTGSEMVSKYSGGGSLYESTVGSGNLAYLSNSERNPFSAVISAGYLVNTGGGVSSSGFANIAASQVYRTRSWVFVASDALSYLPQSPTTGLSGIPGLGDVGVLPVQTGLGPDQTILTTSGQRLTNGLNGSATWQLTSSTDLQGSASWQILRFVGNSVPGFNTDDYSFSFGPDHRIDARDSINAAAYYSRQTYPEYQNARVETSGVNVGFTRSWTRAFTTSISAGPETTHGVTITKIPSQVSIAVTASASYAGRRNGATLSYVRAVNGGSGVIFGAMSDTASLGLNLPLSRVWNFGVSGAYSRSVALSPVFGEVPRTNTVYVGAQASRRLTESLSMYASYTLQHQSASGFSPLLQLLGISNAYTGFNNIGAVGITFAPAPLNRGR